VNNETAGSHPPRAATGSGDMSQDARRRATGSADARPAVRLRAVVIDDERLARRELRGMLAAHDAIDVVGEAASVEQAVATVAALRPDVIFLDIQLSPGTGFDLLERLDHPVRVVFVTAFDAFALRAFEVNALDYLLKPINPLRLAQAVARLTGAAEPRSAEGAAAPPGRQNAGADTRDTRTGTHAETRASLASGPPPDGASSAPVRPLTLDDRLFVEAHGRSRFLRVAEVVCIAAEGDYSQVHAAGGQRWLMPKSLREWEERLPPQQFARIHRSVIVNLDCVERLESAFSRGYLVHLRGMPTPVGMSRRRAARLKALFE
jgi:two-component system LytT family response regulator